MSVKDLKGVTFNSGAKTLIEGLEELRETLNNQPQQPLEMVGVIGCPFCGCAMVIRDGAEIVCPRCKTDIYTGPKPE